MDYPVDKEYHTNKKSELLDKFDEEARIWRPVINKLYWHEFAGGILWEARKEFEALIPHIPYIGGDENHLTNSLLESVRYLALYKAMKKHGKTAEETGKILYKAILTRIYRPLPVIPAKERLTTMQFVEQRRERAEKAKELRYPGNYAFDFIMGDGKEFDRGSNFTECAALKFFHAQGADEFMPFYCYLDFPKSKVIGVGFSRTMTLAEGYKKCNNRIKIGGETKLGWPPPFVKKKT
ncbi:MAG: hypothetical protein A2Y89_00960 [Chloroflexi bacterium RBG_13_51_18]|nr:MAG: hypothetical protein A2Y89_00960 [Chloroflexi bacterium RBG_13_51_18]